MTTQLEGEWTLTGDGVECAASIPGDFHSAMIKAGLMKNPFYGFNERDCLEAGRKDWTITRKFTFHAADRIRSYLVIDGADTVFSVSVNGTPAGGGHNQFCRHRFDITEMLRDGDNTISLTFFSAEMEAEKRAASLPYPVPYMKYDVYSPHRNLVRKCQCHGGWDWGPCLMVSGIYGGIRIESAADGYFRSFAVRTIKVGESPNLWKVRAMAEFTAETEMKKDFVFHAETAAPVTVHAELRRGVNMISAEIQVTDPEPWRTAGELAEAGVPENRLYVFSVSEKDSVTEDVSVSVRTGFSTLKAVSERDGTEQNPGRSLYFENNGRRIFAKGANWIPADALPSGMTDERYRTLLVSAVSANMNTIRVWGGGIYENDIFYELCDRLGLIVWQDFMFACALYPATDEFLEDVETELEFQITRLKSHACIGLWCGNNENFGALGWFPESRRERDRYLVDYDRLYHGTVGKAVARLDPSRLYWPSSPCPGPDTFADNWHSDTMGDMHYWSVWHERKDFSSYLSVRPRFVSEFGYESFPSPGCIGSFAEKDEMNFTAPVMEYHQRSPGGNSIILENFSRYFRFPDGFRNMVYLSQVQQAEAIRTAVDWWRSLKPHCMGILIWQLNDVWPGPSWSSIEYSGKWKLLHYAAKKFFAPFYTSVFMKDGRLNIHASSDLDMTVSAETTVRMIGFDGTVLSEITLETEIPPDGSVPIVTGMPLPGYSDFFIYSETTAVTAGGGRLYCDGTCFPEAYKKCGIMDPELESGVAENGDGSWSLTLRAARPAFFVSADSTASGRFDRNMITVLPGRPEVLIFTPDRKGGGRPEFSIADLRGTYS